MADNCIFLAPQQALRAICLDFRTYAPQVMLFCEIMRLITEDEGITHREAGSSGAWVRTANGRMQWCQGRRLAECLCQTLRGADLAPHRLASICSRVFQTRVQSAHDPVDGRAGIAIVTDLKGWRCRQCGRCCRVLDYHDQVDEQDVQRWEALGRDDILRWVGRTRQGNGRFSYQIWVVPGTRRYAEACPFLTRGPGRETWVCRIHDVKPAICRQYPLTRKHALMTGCRGFEAD
jgi:Fe-S-cluster containining protein